MKKQPVRVYADTSVYGGVFDDDFTEASTVFFNLVRKGVYSLCVSDVVHQELSRAPEKVVSLFNEYLQFAQLLDIDQDALDLQNAYISAGILSEKWYDDALHVALATVSECNVIVSWNFKHIVNFKKIPLFNAVNVLRGYRTIAIHSPTEMVDYEE
jgi:hypothetical protein